MRQSEKGLGRPEDLRGSIMNRNFARALCFVLATACLGAMVNGAMAGSFTRGCATRDLQILMLIEEREATRTISSERIIDAMHNLIHARMVCHEGRPAEALAIYDGINQAISQTVISAPVEPLDGAETGDDLLWRSPKSKSPRPH
jgi:hypothetical protein